MQQTIRLFLILSLFTTHLPLASAHQHHRHDQKVEVEFSEGKIPLTKEDANSIIEQAHEIIEGDESGGFFKRWKNAFDFKTRFVDAYRWASASNESLFRNLILDSLLLFGVSHLLEMASGPILLAIGSANSWPAWLMGLITGGGILISIPGLDPLCILIFGTYAKSPKFREGVGYARLALVRGAEKALSATGAQEFLARVFARKDIQPWLVEIDRLRKMEVQEDGSVIFEYHFMPGTYVQVLVRNQKASLIEMKVSQLTPAQRIFFDELMYPLGWNARHFANLAFKESSSLKHKPYVTGISREDSSRIYSLKENAIVIRSPLKNLDSFDDCSSALTMN